MTLQNGTRLAALDLGSNSFRLEIGRYDSGSIHRQAYYKEAIHQGAGLDVNNVLSEEAMQRGWDCLTRFAEQLAGFQHAQVRAVATQTLREAVNREVFLTRAHQILGFPIDVVSGHEEARLIYQGVAHTLPQSDERRLVVDIGGRSSEFILGHGLSASTMQSYRLGSSSWSQRYFADGQLTPTTFHNARIAAMAVLDETSSLFGNSVKGNSIVGSRWDIAYGSSGTVGAVAEILSKEGFDAARVAQLSKNLADVGDGVITLQGLLDLQARLLAFQTIDRIQFDGLKDDRKLVIAGGLVILLAIFELLNIDYMVAAQGALRQGALYDLVDRSDINSDVRLASVNRLAVNFQVDAAQALRVETVASHLFNQHIASYLSLHGLDAVPLHKKLTWAARLHEMGSLISHDDCHKHGAYILLNADAPGFAVHELQRLSLLVLGHRGKLKKLGDALESDPALAAQLMCLRLAVLLCHARGDVLMGALDTFSMTVNENSSVGAAFSFSYPATWETSLPQTVLLLGQESEIWRKTAHTLTLNAV
jgi:exopolyphosphatase / guanosine-5'-triphosphate,3'-diphosphate pyrophosphatase